MTYTTTQTKKSTFTTDDDITNSSLFDFIKAGVNKKTTWQNIIDQIAAVYGLGIRLYETESAMIADTNLSLGDHAIVEENHYRLYEVTNVSAGTGDVTLSNGLIAGQQGNIVNNKVADYAELRALRSSIYADGDTVSVTNTGIYGTFIVRTGTVTDDNIALIVFSDDPGRYAERDYDGAVNAKWAGILGDGSIEKTAIDSFEDYLLSTKQNGYFPSGTYDVGNSNWPFKNSVSTSLKDYFGITIFGDGDETVFRTTSNNGADVLQLNAIKNIRFEKIKLTAILTDTIGAGSNTCSITNGGVNIILDDILVDSAPYIDAGTFLDGGKGFSIQPGSSTNELSNIKIKGRAKNCGYAANVDIGYNKFDSGNTEGTPSNIEFDIVAEDCWRGLVLSGATATATISDVDKTSSFKIRATCINCAQSLISARWVRADIAVNVVTTKLKSSLLRPYAADQTVYGASITGDYYSTIRINGRMEECDNKLIFGAASQAFSVFGGSDGTQVYFDMDSASTIGDEVSVTNISGNTTRNCTTTLANISDGTGTDLVNSTGIVTFGTELNVSTLIVPRLGQAYDTFKAESDGDVFFLRSGSGSPGSADGFMTIKDTNTGTSYNIQLYT